MCGIVGFKTDRNLERCCEELNQATSCLAHRGPDDSDLFLDHEKGVGLGHRRLSIIDLSLAARQPMASDDRRVLITYNGELYNFRKIRQNLERRGHRFRSDSDTEVVLKAYLEWGIKAVENFVGMFAFAIWDTRYDRFVLVRDRLGIKPLYYYLHNGIFLFASELKAMMAFRCFAKDLDPDALALFLHYQYIPSPKTIFKDAFKLLPGHLAVYEGGQVAMQAYWEPGKSNLGTQKTMPSETDTLDELDGLLGQSISDRLVSDVPLGALLSGGIDSSLVVAMMQKAGDSPVQTFSIGFEEDGYDEAPWAAEVAGHLGTDHTQLYISPTEAMDVIPRLPEIYDEPFADSSAIPTLLVSRLARSRVTVALSGDGGDEQFAGYVRYGATRSASRIFKRVPRLLRGWSSSILGNIPCHWVESIYLPWRRFLPQRLAFENFRDKWQKFVGMLLCDGISDLYEMTVCLWSREELRMMFQGDFPVSRFDELFLETEGWPLLSRFMRVDQGTYLPDGLLTKVDRASMAVSLEVRVPLLDHRVMEYTAQLPETLKYRNGQGKYILKRLLARYVPPSLFERPKMGFGIPLGKWLKGDLKPLLMDYLAPERLKREGLFDHGLVEEEIQGHLSGRNTSPHRLWSILMWEMWRERWL